jgi:hypothetical protein
VGVPRNIRCSKKCAKPDLPGSTSLRDPAWTTIWTLTRFGNPVGTTITLRSFGSVVSVASNGRTAPGDGRFESDDCANNAEASMTATRVTVR